MLNSIYAINDLASNRISGKIQISLFLLLLYSISVFLQPPPVAPVLPVAPPQYPTVQHATVWNGDHVLSASQREWAAEDAAQHALILAHWRIKLLRVRRSFGALEFHNHSLFRSACYCLLVSLNVCNPE